jgi:hypothetical protein
VLVPVEMLGAADVLVNWGKRGKRVTQGKCLLVWVTTFLGDVGAMLEPQAQQETLETPVLEVAGARAGAAEKGALE